MAQDFYFKFFAREFLTSKEVREMSLQDQAILVRLWCVCCLDGTLPDDLEDLSMASGVKQVFLHMFEHLFEQYFEQDSSGHWFSPRMERERERNQQIREKRSSAGKASGKARKEKHDMNICSNISSNISTSSHSHTKIKEVRSHGKSKQGGTTKAEDWAPPLEEGA